MADYKEYDHLPPNHILWRPLPSGSSRSEVTDVAIPVSPGMIVGWMDVKKTEFSLSQLYMVVDQTNWFDITARMRNKKWTA